MSSSDNTNNRESKRVVIPLDSTLVHKLLSSSSSNKNNKKNDKKSKSSSSSNNNNLGNELLVSNMNISHIGTIEVELSNHIRVLDISFNPISSLHGLDQMPQLRLLAAYSCLIKSADGIIDTKFIETILLQSNELTKISTDFLYLKKLKVLRLDRNKITTIDNLHQCSSLKSLDLSWNKLSTLEGISGLQSLEDLRLNNNNITSLKPLRALPSLSELEISNNELTNMNGLEQLPTLQTLRAENNKIQIIQIPQTYTHLNKKTSTLRQSIDENKSTTISTKKKNQNSINSAKEQKSQQASSNIEGGKQVTLGMPCLSEVYLSGNKIKTLKGFNTLGTSMEVLDLSSNLLEKCDDVILFTSNLVPHISLKNLKIENNPLSNHEETMKKVIIELKKNCPSIEMCDNIVLKKPPTEAEALKQILSSPSKKLININDVEDVPSTKVGDQDSDYESDVDNENFDNVFQYNLKRRGPRLSLKDILSNEDIEYMETVFKELLEKSKMTLTSILNTPLEELFIDVTRNIKPLSLLSQLKMRHKVEKEQRDALKPKQINIDSPTTMETSPLVPISDPLNANERKLSMFTFDNNFNVTSLLIDDLSLQVNENVNTVGDEEEEDDEVVQIADDDSFIGSTFIIDKVRKNDNTIAETKKAEEKAKKSIKNIKDELRLLRGSIDSVMRSAEKIKPQSHYDSRSITNTLSSPNFDYTNETKELRRVKSEPKNTIMDDDDNNTINTNDTSTTEYDIKRYNKIKPNPGNQVNVENRENVENRTKFKIPNSVRDILQNDNTLENYLRQYN